MQKVLGQWQILYGRKKIKNQQPKHFEKWEDAIPYLGKPITVSFVESPDITDILTGISLVMNGDRIITALLEVRNNKWEFWKCKP